MCTQIGRFCSGVGALLTSTLLLAGCAAHKHPAQDESTTDRGGPTAPQAATAAQASVPAQAAVTPQPATPPVASQSTATTEHDPLPAGAAAAPAPFEGSGWQDLFDGISLEGWKETQFAGHGQVELRSGVLLLNMGDPFTGVNYTNTVPKMDYEVALDAMRVMGSDFFCGLTVPVGESFCSLIVGGWGGSLVGISSLDGMDASENETSKFMNFLQGKWYRIRLRVTKDRLEGWIDQEKLIDVNTEGRKISLRPGDIELSAPFGIAAWQTSSAIREVKIRKVDGPADKKKKAL